MNRSRMARIIRAIALASLLPPAARADVSIDEPLTGGVSAYPWLARDGACLTAGASASKHPVSGTSTIPACVGLEAYAGKIQVGGHANSLPDPIGHGALRLTNGDLKQDGRNGRDTRGSVVSLLPFPTDQGVHVTFTTVTYGGNGWLNANGKQSGADGMVFFLLDAARDPSIGAPGGSLGYACSNLAKYRADGPDGVDGGYLSVAIDEYGNFSNPGDSTADGPGKVPGAVVVRGAGSIAYAALQRDYGRFYPSGLADADRALAVRNTCRTGLLQNWSGADVVDKGVTVAHRKSTARPIIDYPLLAPPLILKDGDGKPIEIYSQEAVPNPVRGKATALTYDLSITPNRVLDLRVRVGDSPTFFPVVANQSLKENGTLPGNLRFGFSASTGGGTNVHEITCFKAEQLDAAANSAGTNAQQSGRVEAGSQVFLSFYHPKNSWGQLTASNLLVGSDGSVFASKTANWDAHCVLTGGTCDNTGVATKAQAPDDRAILSWNGSNGIPFRYDRFSAADQVMLGGAGEGEKRVDFLRGDRRNEYAFSGGGMFRKRDGVLGDIVNASPAFVGFPNLPYAVAGKDLLTGADTAEFGTGYAAFAKSGRTRTNVVYSGANDGMLHGFRAGSFDGGGKFDASRNDGAEVLAYVPGAVVRSIHSANLSLDFSSPYYAHNSYVDATPATGDLYYAGSWHTWLVGGLGSGGNPAGVVNAPDATATGVLYALDITDPTRFSNKDAADTIVIGEWTSATLECVDGAECKDSLGSIVGTPIIRRLHDGNWAVIFGNGRNSATGTAGVFIMSVNRLTGRRTVRFLDTGHGSTSAKNGIDYVAAADLDGDHVTDYLYAGDAAGNVWRFDLTGSSPNDWKADRAPLFTTPAGQPISTRVTVTSSLPARGPARVIIAFGTGRRTTATLVEAAGYANGRQSLYGIWDWNMAGWNKASDTKYASLVAPQAFSASDLQAQTIVSSVTDPSLAAGFRWINTTKPVCWNGSATCPVSNTQFGWKVALPTSQEQILYNPVVAFGALIVNTAVPGGSSGITCNSWLPTGYTMAISLDTGGAPTSSVFRTVATSAGAANVDTIVGIGHDGTGTPSIVTVKGKPFLVQQTAGGKADTPRIDAPANGIGRRITWTKLR